MTRRTVKLVLVGYAVKTALVAGLWLAAPDLARQATDKARTMWAGLTGAAPSGVKAAAPASR